MADPSLFRLRVVFRKAGRLALLSHLEVARALERAVRRAGLPFAVSQGFSPHMRIAFGAALPVGVGGEREFYDLFLTRYVAPAKCLEALRAASPDDLMVLECAYVEHAAPAASVAYPLSTYRVDLTAPVGEWPVPDAVTVVRKKKEKELAVAEYLAGEMLLADDGRSVMFALEAKPTGSLRPDKLVDACLALMPEESRPQRAALTRIAQSDGATTL